MELIVNGATVDSLDTLVAAQVSSVHKVGALEGDFQMSRIALTSFLTLGFDSDSNIALNNQLYLVLARGDLTTANVATALGVGGNPDLTPAGGTIFGEKKARESSIILMLPFKYRGVSVDVANATVVLRQDLEYNGGPLGMSLRAGVNHSYVFPKNVGWAWHVYNAGSILGSNTNFQMYARMTGRYLDD